jgi:hypothetical protein
LISAASGSFAGGLITGVCQALAGSAAMNRTTTPKMRPILLCYRQRSGALQLRIIRTAERENFHLAEKELYKSENLGSGTFVITKPKRKKAKLRQTRLKNLTRGSRK